MGNNKTQRPNEMPDATVTIRHVPAFSLFSLCAIVLVALLIRLNPVVNSPETFRLGLGPFGDSYLYHVIAYNLYKGNGFSGTNDGSILGQREPLPELSYAPAIVRAPLYPAFLAGAYSVLGSRDATLSPSAWRVNFNRVRVAQCVLDALVCLLVFFIVRLVVPVPDWPALLAAILYALSPYNIFYTRALLTESLATFMVAAATLVTILGLRQGRPLWWFLAGAGWGVVALCRPEYLPFAAAVAAYMFIANWGRWRVACKSLIIVALGAALTVSPWVIRNYVLFDRATLAVGGLGYGLYLGTFETNTNWTGWNKFPDEIFADARQGDEVRALEKSYAFSLSAGTIDIEHYDGRFLQLALDRIRHDPWDTVRTWAIRIPRLWYQFYIPMYRDREASGYYALFYITLALYGFVRASSEEKRLLAPMGLLCVYVTLLYLPLHIEPRYSVPCMPSLVSLCAIGLWKAWSWGANRRRAQMGDFRVHD